MFTSKPDHPDMTGVSGGDVAGCPVVPGLLNNAVSLTGGFEECTRQLQGIRPGKCCPKAGPEHRLYNPTGSACYCHEQLRASWLE